MPPPASAFNTFPPDTPKAMQKPEPLDRVRSVARLRHLGLRTEQAYSDWIRRFILSRRKRHPEGRGAEEMRQFLPHLAVEGSVSAPTRNVARCALLSLYRDVPQVELPYAAGITRAERPARVPVVFTRAEVDNPMSRPSGTCDLVAGLLHGAGLRLREAVRLRVRDLASDSMEILVRGGEGEKDRRTVVPRPLSGPPRHHPEGAKLLHENDLREGPGEVYLP